MFSTSNPFAPRPPVRIKLREDSPSGITLEGGAVLEPGQEADVEFHLASHLVVTGRATIVQPVQPDPAAGDDEFAEKLGDDELDPKLDDEIVEEPEPPVIVETRDPKPSRRR